MIVTKISDGLGNQLFQYAFGKRMAVHTGQQLALDISDFEISPNAPFRRKFRLSHFRVSAHIASPQEIAQAKYPYGLASKAWRYVLRKIGKLPRIIRFEPSLLLRTGSMYLEGFWQSEKYFSDIRQEIVREFALKEAFSPGAAKYAGMIRTEKNSVSLSVRRGDYAQHPKVWGTYCDQAYYTRALEYVAAHSDGPLYVFIFSDDIEWVKKNITIPFQTTYIENKEGKEVPDYEALILMSMCTNHVIANSTFSWWGAWLDARAEKIVVAPSEWIPGINLPIDDIVPSEWVKM